MVTVTFCNRNGLLQGFTVEGHSGFDRHGKDIVCASVSSCALMVANTVTEIMHLNAQAEAKDGYLRLWLLEQPERAQDLLNGFQLHMTELAKEYPKYVLCKTTNI